MHDTIALIHHSDIARNTDPRALWLIVSDDHNEPRDRCAAALDRLKALYAKETKA